MALIAISRAERQVFRLIQVNCERQGYQVSVWRSVDKTLEQIESSKPDILLVDSDGVRTPLKELIREVRRLHPPIRIIVLRGKNHDQDDDDAEADLYITKPFNPVDLGGGPPPTAYA